MAELSCGKVMRGWAGGRRDWPAQVRTAWDGGRSSTWATGCWLWRTLRRVSRVKLWLSEWRLPGLKRGPGELGRHFHPFTGEQHHRGGALLQLCFYIEMETVSFCCCSFGFVSYLISPPLLFLQLVICDFIAICISLSFYFLFFLNWGRVADAVTQMVKNLPAMQETQGRSLGREDLLEKGRASHSSILAWRVPWTEEPGEIQSVYLGFQRVRHDWAANTFSFIVALWCRACFCYTAKCTSYTYTCVASFLDFLPTEVAPEHWGELPVLLSRSPLVIHLVHVLCWA